MRHTLVICFLSFVATGFWSSCVVAHHVLGRPAYSLNEDSNTPPSMHVETQVGEYFVTYMVFPAFPKPNEPGRINLYAKRIEDGEPFDGRVVFSTKDDGLFGKDEEPLGSQTPDETVYRQGFVFKESGDYIITARFDSGGDHHTIDFPLRVGARPIAGPLGVSILIVVLMLIGVKIINRKRLIRATIRDAHRTGV